MKTPMRLVAKMKLSVSMGILFICLAGTAGFMMAADDAKEKTPRLELLSWGLSLSFLCVLVSLAFVFKYYKQRRDAWRDHVRTRGVSPTDLREKMRGAPSGSEVYTLNEACILAAVYNNSVEVSASPPRLVYTELQVLERKGWIYFTFTNKYGGGGVENGVEDVVARPTEQAWAAIDELCPRDWSPEDRIIGPMASYI